MITTLQHDQDGNTLEWSVWVALQPGDPFAQRESFCIGVGTTPAEACAQACRTLNQALDDVVVLAHEQGAEVARA